MQPMNFLQQVQTYQEANAPYLTNEFGVIANTNSKFREFNKLANNLGSSVTFDLPPRFLNTSSLVANYQPAVQRVERLTVNYQESVAFQFSNQQMIFNIDPMNYMKNFGMSAIKELGNVIETTIAQDFVTSPYRFYGNGFTDLNSFGILANALAMYREYGSANGMAKGFLPNLTVPQIVNTGLNQFALTRNNEDARSWEVGEFSNCSWIRSNLLSPHIAGTEGNSKSLLTVVSTDIDANGNITAITFSGTNAANDPNSVKQYDRFEIVPTSGFLYPTFYNFIGNHVSNCPVQFQAAANASSNGSSQVKVTLLVPLYIGVSITSNPGVAGQIIPGMTARVLPNHIAGCIYSGNPHMFAMPELDILVPYPTATKADEDTGVSIRQYYGAIFGQNVQTAMVYDCVFGSRLIPEYAMALIFPYNNSTLVSLASLS